MNWKGRTGKLPSSFPVSRDIGQRSLILNFQLCQACVKYASVGLQWSGDSWIQIVLNWWKDSWWESGETSIEDAPLGGVCGVRKETDENQRDVVSREFPLLFPSLYISFLFFSFPPSFPPSLPPWQGKFLEEMGKVGMDGKSNPEQEEKPMMKTEVWLRVEMNLVIYLFYVL